MDKRQLDTDDMEVEWLTPTRMGDFRPTTTGEDADALRGNGINSEELFIRMKMSINLLRALNELPKFCLPMYMLVEMLSHMRGTSYAGDGYVRVSKGAAAVVGITNTQTRRATIKRLEEAGHFQVVRKGSKAPMCKILPYTGDAKVDMSTIFDDDAFEDYVLARAGVVRQL